MPALGFTSTEPDGYVSQTFEVKGIIEIVMPVGYMVVLTRNFGAADVNVNSGSAIQPQFSQ